MVANNRHRFIEVVVWKYDDWKGGDGECTSNGVLVKRVCTRDDKAIPCALVTGFALFFQRRLRRKRQDAGAGCSQQQEKLRCGSQKRHGKATGLCEAAQFSFTNRHATIKIWLRSPDFSKPRRFSGSTPQASTNLSDIRLTVHLFRGLSSTRTYIKQMSICYQHCQIPTPTCQSMSIHPKSRDQA